MRQPAAEGLHLQRVREVRIVKLQLGKAGDAARVNLARIRKMRGLSYAELARRLAQAGHPIVDTSLLKIEKGDRRIDVDDLAALAAALEVSAAMLLGESDCAVCRNNPPAGFTCDTCGKSGTRVTA